MKFDDFLEARPERSILQTRPKPLQQVGGEWVPQARGETRPNDVDAIAFHSRPLEIHRSQFSGYIPDAFDVPNIVVQNEFMAICVGNERGTVLNYGIRNKRRLQYLERLCENDACEKIEMAPLEVTNTSELT